MRNGPDSEVSRAAVASCPWQQWLPGMVGGLGLLGIAKLGQLADRRHWWFRDQYELLSLLIAAAFIGAFCLIVLTVVRLTKPSCGIGVCQRIAATIFFMAMGIKVGLRYVHMCAAGSAWIEGAAILGTPVLAGAVVLVCKRPWLRYATAVAVLTAVWVLARPYLDWAHGN